MLVMILLAAAFLLWLGYCFLVIYPAYRRATEYTADRCRPLTSVVARTI